MSGYSEVEKLKEAEIREETLPSTVFLTREQEADEISALKKRVAILEKKLEEYTNGNYTEKL